MTGYEHHLFICTNGDSKSSCGGKGAKDLRSDLKKALKKRYKKSELRVNQCGCLGYCKEGIAAVLYPEGKWFLGKKKSDAESMEKEIVDIIEGKSE